MTDNVMANSWFLNNLSAVMRCLRKDGLKILLAAALCAAAGAAIGKLTNTATSTAQLVLTPLPLRSATEDDVLARMVAVPMDMKTASLLCVSDAVLQATLDELNKSGKFKTPLDNLATLRNALDFEITIAKETPYETLYSPVLKLTAKGKTAAEAKLMADTWALQCVAAAESFVDIRQSPTVDAFKGRASDAGQELDAAEAALEAFWRENNIEQVNQRINTLIGLSNNYVDARAKMAQDINEEGAKVAALESMQETEPKTLQLNWTPSGKLLGALGQQLGLKGAPSSDADNPELLVLEQINPVSTEVRTQLATSQASKSGYEARIQELDQQMLKIEAELVEQQQKLAALKSEEYRLSRDRELKEEAYKTAALNHEYARMASGLNPSEFRLLSLGAEWRLPRFRRAILFGFTMGWLGLFGAAFCSIAWRLILKPALAQPQ